MEAHWIADRAALRWLARPPPDWTHEELAVCIGRSRRREEAQLIALACGPAPVGKPRWTLRRLSDKIVQLHYVDQISYETVRQLLKKPYSGVLKV